MSVFDALDDQNRQRDQGWTYSNSYSRAGTTLNNSSSSIEEWSSPPAQQQAASGGPAFVYGDHFVQEIKSSDTDDELMMVDEPGVILGREEILDPLSDPNVMASSGYQSYTHNSYHYNQAQDPQTAYNHSQGHSQYMEQRHVAVGVRPQHGNHIPQQRHMQLPLHVHEDYPHSQAPGAQQQHLQQQQRAQAQQHHQLHIVQQHPSQGASLAQQLQQSRSQQPLLQQHQSRAGQSLGQHQFSPGLGQQFQGQQLRLGQQLPVQSPHQQQNQMFNQLQGMSQQHLGQQQTQQRDQHQLYSRQQSIGHQQPASQQQGVGQQSAGLGQQQQQSFGQQQSFQSHGQQQGVQQSDQHLPQGGEQRGVQPNKPPAQGMLRQMLDGPPVTASGSSVPARNQQYQHEPMNTGDTKYTAHHPGQMMNTDQHPFQQHSYTQQPQQQMSPLQQTQKFSPNSGSEYYLSAQMREQELNGRVKTEPEQYFMQSSPSSSQNSPQISTHGNSQVPLQSSSQSSSPLVSVQNAPLIMQNSPGVLQNSRVLFLSSPVQSSAPVPVQSASRLVLHGSRLMLQNSPQLSAQNSPQLSLQNSPQLSLQNSPQTLHLQGLPQLVHSSPQVVHSSPQVVHSSPQVVNNSPQVVSNSLPVVHTTPRVVQATPPQVGQSIQPNVPQNVQPNFQLFLNSPAGSSNQLSQQQPSPCHQLQQGEGGQKGGNHFHPQTPMASDILNLLRLPSTSKVVFTTANAVQGFQENTYYSVQHNGGSKAFLYNGKELIPSPQTQEQKVETSSSTRGRGRGQSKAGRGRQGGAGRGRGKAESVTGLHLAPQHHMVEEATTETNEKCFGEPMVEDPLAADQGINSPQQGTELSSVDCSSPPSSTVVPRFSATNEIWPTPMPSQQSGDSPDMRSPPALPPDENNYSPPALPVQTAPPPPPVPKLTPEERRAEQRRKHNLADDEDGSALCKYCGYCSVDFEVCEGCSRKLPVDVKVVVKRRKVEQPVENESETERTVGGGKINTSSSTDTPTCTAAIIDKKAFYGSKLQTQNSAFANKMEEFSSEFTIKPTGRTFTRRGRGAGSRGVGRTRKPKEPKEPVTLTISSDEDDGPGPNGEGSRRVSVSAGASTSTSQNDDDDFFSVPVKPTSSFGMGRKQRMADASGRCPPVPKAPPPAIVTVSDGVHFNVRGVRVGSMRTTGLEVRFMTRSIQFKVIGDRTQEELDFFVYVTELTQILFSLNQSQPVAFLKVTPGCGNRLRSSLRMMANSPEYFDPGSQDPKRNMIVVIIDLVTNDKGMRQTLSDYARVQNEFPDFLREITYDEANDLLVKSTPGVLTNLTDRALRNYHKLNAATSTTASPGSTTPSSTPQALSDQGDSCGGVEGQEETDGHLHLAAGDAGEDSPSAFDTPPEGRTSHSPSPPRIIFTGPVEKLLTYPSMSTKGAITITNEDLFCLHEGEFLNDVIIDFYLKYVFLEKLNEEDRERTQIFSSFFFKRLTQRDSKSQQEPTEVKLTPAEKRHARVKRWTKHVDIFSKDFLFIPINEHSHWYLAVICFPGLESQEHISYLPASPPVEDGGSESQQSENPSNPSNSPSDDGAGAKESSSSDSISGAKTENHVLGKVIPAEVAKKGKTKFNLGVKQPCILIMDSLMGPSRNSVIRILKEYLQVEWDLKKGTPRNMIKSVRGGCPKVPQQTNYSDCGVFVLQYAETFFENPIASFSIPMKLERWFPLTKVEKKREEIRDLILHLQAEVNEGSNR
ncbi:uncharacterized protein [Littorina saxatilis]|uniref:uncharacterized protein isoform X2 n=1 Tax=Littorina saxatilis TaxID=31220 RepID=UPI0038B47BF8